ncbi:MAG: 50S ribosomal protein L16 [Parcubacteria group bacterium]
MLQPKKIQHRKMHKNKKKRKAGRGHSLSFGSYGLKSLEPAWITSAQIESARRTVARAVQRGGKLWIRIFPDQPRTKKGAEVGMGGGAGSLDHFVAPIGAGRMLFEIDGVTEELARNAFRLATHKLPVKTKFIKK